MIARTAMLCLICLAAWPLQAGLWDRDRPTVESTPDTFDVIVGRFDRYPDTFYQQRHKLALRQINELGDTPTDTEQLKAVLPAFDDAAVALYRLGRPGEAIIMLDRKNLRVHNLAADQSVAAHEYTMRANTNKAAVLMHRWLASNRQDLTDLKAAADLLHTELATDPYNADAQWSLTEVEWLLSQPKWHPDADPVFPNLLGLNDVSFHGTLEPAALARNNVAGCIDFLSRRIMYEDGWQNIDVMYAFSLALALSGMQQESLFAWFRVCELIDAGKTTQVVNAPAPKSLKRVLGVHLADVQQKSEAEQRYTEMRAKADAWVAARNRYLQAAMAEGRHPETDPAFWAAFREDDSPAPAPDETQAATDPLLNPTFLVIGLGGFVVILLLLVASVIFLGRRSAPAPRVDEL